MTRNLDRRIDAVDADLARRHQVAIGKDVREMFDFIGDKPPEFWQEFATEMKRRDLLQAETDKSPTEGEFTDQQGEDYGVTPCPFRAYNGIAYRAVPYDYLANLVEKGKILEKYVKWRWKKGMRQ